MKQWILKYSVYNKECEMGSNEIKAWLSDLKGNNCSPRQRKKPHWNTIFYPRNKDRPFEAGEPMV